MTDWPLGSTNEYRVDIEVLERLAALDKCEPSSPLNHDKCELSSPINDIKVRTEFTHRDELSVNLVPISVNLSADKCELGSPNQSKTRQDPGSADAPELTPSQKLFGGYRLYLESFGIPHAAAGKLLGKWKRDLGDDADALVGIIERARSREVVDPVPWITASVTQRQKSKSTAPTPSQRAIRKVF